MTGGSWRLSVSARAAGVFDYAGAVRPPRLTVAAGKQQTMRFGTAAGEFTTVVFREYGLSAGASNTHDLFDGSLLDVHGDAAPFRRLRGFALWVEAGGDASGVVVGNAAANAHPLFMGAGTHTATAFLSGPGLVGGSPAGVPVTSTSRNVLVTNVGLVEVTYTLCLAGSTAAPGAAMGVLGLTYP